MSKTRRMLRFRLYPTREQETVLNSQLALCCELYNAALQERRDAWRINRKPISFRAQSGQLPEIKKERPDVGVVYSQVLQDVLRQIDKTFKAFFRRVKTRSGKAGFPRFCSCTHYDSLTYPQSGFTLNSKLMLSKIGNIKIKLHRSIEGKIKTCTIKRDAGRWYAIFSCEVEPKPLQQSTLAVGIDVGLTHFATLSTGEQINNPRHYKAAQAELHVAQRKVSRRKKGSKRRRKAVQLLQRIHAHIRNQRSDFHHKESRKIVNQFGLIAVEDLNIKGLAAGMLAKSVGDAGWASFISKIAYKAESAGRVLIKVNPRGTSQRCLCGAEVRKTLADRWHDCSACGLSEPRDLVSAKIILGLGLSLQVPTYPVAECVA